MYLWRRFATQKWAERNEEKLRGLTGNDLAIVEQPNRKRLQFEVATRRRTDLLELTRQFGGRIEKLPDDWLKRSLRLKTKPVNVGNQTLIIPAGAAFGTGEHATTSMCLRILEKVTHNWDRDWSLVDLGTGSGILALAAKILGAKRVAGVDNDPVAIRTARQNAVLNKIRDVKFRLGDVRRWKSRRGANIVAANLFSEVLIEILPNLGGAHLLILSGILRNQEAAVRRALTRANAQICEVRRRGKWVAMLAGHK